MINSTSLEDLNLHLTYYLIPTFVLMGLLLVVGSSCNSLLLYNYFYSFKRTTHWYFIVTLALYDLLICTVVTPLGFHNLSIYYLPKNARVCQLYRLVENVAVFGSMCILICIAAHTYVKICHPFYRVKIRFIKMVCWSTFIGAMFINVPLSFTVFGVSAKTTAVPGIMGLTCDISEDFIGSKVELGYKSLLGFLTVGVVISFSVFYGLVIRKMRKQQDIFVSRANTPSKRPPFTVESGVAPSTLVSATTYSEFTRSPVESELETSLDPVRNPPISLDFAGTAKPQTFAPVENSCRITLTTSASPESKPSRKTSKELITPPPKDGETVLKENRDSGNAGKIEMCATINQDTMGASSISPKESFTSYPPSGSHDINEVTSLASSPVEKSPSHPDNNWVGKPPEAPELHESSDVDKDLNQDRMDPTKIQRVLFQNPDAVMPQKISLSPSCSSPKIKFWSVLQSSLLGKTHKKLHADTLSSSNSNLLSKAPAKTLFKTLIRTLVIPKILPKGRFVHPKSHESDVGCEKVVQSADPSQDPIDEGLNHQKSSGKRNVICSENATNVSPVQESCTLKLDSTKDRRNPSNNQTAYTHDPNNSVHSKSGASTDSSWKVGIPSWIHRVVSGTQVISQESGLYSTMSGHNFLSTSKSSGFIVDSKQRKPPMCAESCVDFLMISDGTIPSGNLSDPVDGVTNVRQPYAGTDMQCKEKIVVDPKRVKNKTRYEPSVNVASNMNKSVSITALASKITSTASSTKDGNKLTKKDKKAPKTMLGTKSAHNKSSKTASRTKNAYKLTKTNSSIDQTMKTTTDAKNVDKLTDTKGFDKVMNKVTSVQTTYNSTESITRTKAAISDTVDVVRAKTIGNETQNVASNCNFDNESKYIASLKTVDINTVTGTTDYDATCMVSTKTIDQKRIVGAKTFDSDIKSVVSRKPMDRDTNNVASRTTKTIDNITNLAATQAIGKDFDHGVNTDPIGSNLGTVFSDKSVGKFQPSCPETKQNRWNMKFSTIANPFSFNESLLSTAGGHYGCWKMIKKKFLLMDNASLSVFAISVTFVLCYVPLVALLQTSALDSTDLFSLGMLHFVIKFSYVQNAIHPLIYLVANRKLREIVMMQFSDAVASLPSWSCRRQAQL